MNDDATNDLDDEAEYPRPLGRVKPFARILFGFMALWLIVPIVAGLCMVVWTLGKDISHSVATTDWSWWTWPNVLLALVVPLGIAILVVNRVRRRRRRIDP